MHKTTADPDQSKTYIHLKTDADSDTTEREYYTLTRKQKLYGRIKDVADRIAGVGGLIAASPLFLAVWFMIKKEEGLKAPVFFKQKRVGKDRKLFDLYKFRTMKLSTPHDIPTHLLTDPDQYITSSGHFLRKYSLDEIPQFLNIIKGDMSVCGPRPALWNQDDLIAEREAYGVHQIKPGLTGWAQIHGRDELEIPEKARLDAYYLKHYGFWIDLKCFFGSIFSVAKGDGVVEGGTGEMKRKKEERKENLSSEKKKLLAITNHSYMFWQFRKELMAELQKDYDIVISTPYVGHEDDLAAMGFRMIETKVDRRGIHPGKDLKLCLTYFRLLEKEKPNMVLTYSIKPNIYAGFACRVLKIPYCVNVQGLGTAFQNSFMASLVSIMYKISCKGANTVFFENTGNAQVFIDRKILDKERITVLPGAGINLDYYSYAAYPQHEETRFLYLGRIMKEKGMDELFYAIRKLHDEYGSKVKLDLVGFFEDEYREAIDQLVKEGIAIFHGFQQDPRPFYANADCIVLPSYHEGMSNVLLEAAATGRCIITSDIPGCREAVDSGRNGLTCRVKDGESLYRQMKKVMALSKERLEKIGKAGREKVKKEFKKEDVIRNTIDSIFWGIL